MKNAHLSSPESQWFIYSANSSCVRSAFQKIFNFLRAQNSTHTERNWHQRIPGINALKNSAALHTHHVTRVSVSIYPSGIEFYQKSSNLHRCSTSLFPVDCYSDRCPPLAQDLERQALTARNLLLYFYNLTFLSDLLCSPVWNMSIYEWHISLRLSGHLQWAQWFNSMNQQTQLWTPWHRSTVTLKPTCTYSPTLSCGFYN